MPFKWNDTTERMVLLKFLEQNPTLKLDSQAALNDWPGLEPPTERSIKDRFNLLKKQLRESTAPSSLGQGQTIPTTATPVQSIPKTPGRKARAYTSSASNKKSKVKAEPEDEDTHPLATTPSNPITASKGHSTKQFTSKLLGVKSFSSKRGTKRKGRADEDEEEESMTQSDSDRKGASDEDSPSENARAASIVRRALPDRRSKSKTPANYAPITEDEDESQADEVNNGIEDSDDDKKGNASLKHNSRNGKSEAKGHGNSKRGLEQDESTEDSDGLFDPRADQEAKKDGAENRKATWKERVALGNADDEADDEDMQD